MSCDVKCRIEHFASKKNRQPLKKTRNANLFLFIMVTPPFLCPCLIFYMMRYQDNHGIADHLSMDPLASCGHHCRSYTSLPPPLSPRRGGCWNPQGTTGRGGHSHVRSGTFGAHVPCHGQVHVLSGSNQYITCNFQRS